MTTPLPLFILLIFMIPGVSTADWGVSYSPSHICALKDSTVIMSCTYSYPPGYQIREVYWTKELKDLPDLSEDPEYRQRLQYLGDQQQNCTIRLSHVTLEDSHMYYFRFTTNITEGKWLGKPGVHLTITDLQLESPERVTEGDSVHLTCKSSCELTDRPTFIWSRNSQRLTSANTGNKLTLSPVRRGDAGGYRCAVDGHNLTSAEVQLNVTYPPDKPVISISGSAEIVEGDSVSLICSSDSNPPAEIHWFKGTNYMKSEQTYSISNISSEDSGEYKCKASNTHGEKYSDNVTLNVMYPPRSVSVSVNGSAEIVEGDSVSLICSSDSNPPAEIHWFKGGTFVGSGRIYSISKISSDDSGEYKCRSNNTLGEKYSDNVTLNVMYPPRSVSVLINGSAEIVEGDSVSLTCSSDSNPPALNFSWFQENQSSSVGSGQSFSVGQSGRFYCQAHNRLGSHTSHAVTVTVKGRKFLYVVSGVSVGLGVLIFIFIIIFWRIKHTPDPATPKQDDLYVNVSAHTGLQSKSDGTDQNEGLYSLVTLAGFRGDQTQGKSSESEDTEEIQYVSVLHHRHKDMNQQEESENHYDNIRVRHPDAAMRSPNGIVEDDSVIYSTVK